MTQYYHQMPQPGPRVNDIVVGVLSTSVFVLVGILSIVQFAYY